MEALISGHSAWIKSVRKFTCGGDNWDDRSGADMLERGGNVVVAVVPSKWSTLLSVVMPPVQQFTTAAVMAPPATKLATVPIGNISCNSSNRRRNRAPLSSNHSMHDWQQMGTILDFP